MSAAREQYKPRLKLGLWPVIDSVEAARWAVKHACWMAMLCAVATAGFAVWSYFSPGVATRTGLNLFALVDAAVFLAIGIGIYFNSRVAAVSGLLLYGMERAISIGSTRPSAGILFVIIGVGFINGVRGTFALHSKLSEDVDPAPESARFGPSETGGRDGRQPSRIDDRQNLREPWESDGLESASHDSPVARFSHSGGQFIRVFPVDLRRVFIRWASPLFVIAILSVLANLTVFLDPTRIRTSVLFLLFFLSFTIMVPMLRVLYMRKRQVEFGPDWVSGPTGEFVQTRVIRNEDIKQIESLEDGETFLIRSVRNRVIVVDVGNFAARNRAALVQSLEELGPVNSPDSHSLSGP